MKKYGDKYEALSIFARQLVAALRG
jgi:hypothetical protein